MGFPSKNMESVAISSSSEEQWKNAFFQPLTEGEGGNTGKHLRTTTLRARVSEMAQVLTSARGWARALASRVTLVLGQAR